MAPSKPFVGQRNTPKRNPTHSCETRDIIEPTILWRAFKKQKILKAAAQRQELVDAEKPSGFQLPVAKGILSLGEFPMDVFLEICLYLTPLDLLRLTRLSKKFRAVLLSSQGKYVWKIVYYSHFDTIIPGWSEPKMVSYLLEEHCDDCGKLEASRQWDLGTRLCPACLPRKIVDRSDLHKFWPDIPYTVSSAVSYAKALNVYSLNWVDVRGRARICLRSDVKVVRKRFFKLSVDEKADPKNEVRKKFIEQLKRERETKRRATKALKKWYEARDPQNAKIFERRQKAIAERLLRDHPRWLPSDIPVDEFPEWVKIVKKPYPFSRAEYKVRKDELINLTWKKIGLHYRGTEVFDRWMYMDDAPIDHRHKISHHIKLKP